MNITREDVVRAALTVERWCRSPEGDCYDRLDCPFYAKDIPGKCALTINFVPRFWHLEEFLRKRGLNNGEV